MNISIDEVAIIIGQKQIEIYLLNKRVQELEQELAKSKIHEQSKAKDEKAP